MGMRLFCALSIMVAVACSGDDSSSPPTYQRDLDADVQSDEGCLDSDQDGFCAVDDCDDTDPEVAMLCCVEGADPTEGCPCVEGTESVWCDPNEVADMEAVRDGVHGVLKCSEGARFCRDMQWSACEGVGWIFQPN